MRRYLLLAAVYSLACGATAQDAKPKPAPDVLVFTNGDQLTGKFERALGGNVIFKSDMAGEIVVSLDKVKELRSASEFAVMRKGPPSRQDTLGKGQVTLDAGTLTLTPSAGAPATVAVKDVGYIVDAPTYDRQIARRAGPLEGWNGTLTGGATLVRSTQTSTTFSAAAALVRTIPMVSYFPARNRTAINISETYGKQIAPVLPPTNPPTLPSVVVSNIFHADTERDQYFSPRLYALADASFDHNYSLGLQLQQVYGGGVGWTPFKTPKHELDLKGDVHYAKQGYFSPAPGVPASSAINLFGSTFSESYVVHLPRKLLFTESGNFLPAWTKTHAYAANMMATIAMPVFKRLSASFSTTDNYLNDPQPFYKHNSYQFVTGVTYTLR